MGSADRQLQPGDRARAHNGSEGTVVRVDAREVVLLVTEGGSCGAEFTMSREAVSPLGPSSMIQRAEIEPLRRLIENRAEDGFCVCDAAEVAALAALLERLTALAHLQCEAGE